MRVVITGAGGFLGSRLARMLAADPRVTALRLVDHAGLPDLPPQVSHQPYAFATSERPFRFKRSYE